ncbi:hypothetical protein RM572_03780 [Streptomyces sp. DSM 42041]|uniref:Lipoprotein n=1 Tax=Streptomyces hazeniae TaxID=3075538 RepID=A0ABU2NLW1_9ACTN|nr:hypothetical protein [Streptomyces sp. DSM 42041]MDT0377893.1 hypothetical protein [Streptomyces sp. DSM 42041]
MRVRTRRTGRHTQAARGARAAAVALVLAAGLAACGDDPRPRPLEQSGPDEKTVALVKKTNATMAGTSFTASGTNSAFGGAEQEITWDPEQGFHMTVRADDGEETDMYCREGTSYISAPLLVETLGQRGQQVSLPEGLAGSYVTVQGKSCDAYFAVPESAERAPGRDATVDGRKSRALAVQSPGGADVYHLARSGEPRLLKWDAELEGMETTMTYGGYGERYPVTLPPEDRRIRMTEFQAAVLEAATKPPGDG